jgi:hypothetical protein
VTNKAIFYLSVDIFLFHRGISRYDETLLLSSSNAKFGLKQRRFKDIF